MIIEFENGLKYIVLLSETKVCCNTNPTDKKYTGILQNMSNNECRSLEKGLNESVDYYSKNL